MKPYATQLREHLAESRRNDMAWEDAWRVAVAACTYESDGEPFPMDYAKGAFRAGYLRTTAGSKMGTLAEREHTRPSGEDPEPVVYLKRCGTPGCDRPANPWLCAEHAAVIDAIPPLCNVGVCTRDALPDGVYCGKHKHLSTSNLRGAHAKSTKQAA